MPLRLCPNHYDTEQRIASLGVDWTFCAPITTCKTC